ncbi:MAG: pyridoxal-dependent decarboxylase, partial [Bacteroidota bacterium]
AAWALDVMIDKDLRDSTNVETPFSSLLDSPCDLKKTRVGLPKEYLEANVRGIASGNHWYSEYGLQLSRRMRSLKVWMSIQEHGLEKLGRMITKNIEQAHYLEKQIDKHPRLELVAPVGLDIVCFRYIPKSGDSNHINKEILILLHERGLAVPSYTTLGGIYCIRVAISNHRSVMADFDFLIEKTVEIGAELERAVATV